ncbi:hypothetical protein D3C74_376020 [compost metagenome]
MKERKQAQYGNKRQEDIIEYAEYAVGQCFVIHGMSSFLENSVAGKTVRQPIGDHDQN